MRRLLTVGLVFGIVAALAFAGARMLTGSHPAAAQSAAGPINTVNIDVEDDLNIANMDNGPLGTVQSCVRIDNNGVVDQDEEVGEADFVYVDITAGSGDLAGDQGVPAYNDNGTPLNPADDFGALFGFGMTLNFSGAIVRIENPPGPDVALNQLRMTNFNAGSGPFITNAGGPFPNATGTSSPSQIETGLPLATTAESGEGVIFTAAMEGIGPGLASLSLSGIGILDVANAVYTVTNVNSTPGNVNSYIAVDQACPTPVDLKLQSQVVTFPAQINVSQNQNIVIDKVIHNNGPLTPANVKITKTITLPPDCTLNGAGPGGVQVINATIPSVVISTTTNYQEIDVVHCTQPSTHQITVLNCVAPDVGNGAGQTPLPDTNPNNNCDTDIVNFIVLGSADVKITAQTYTTPGAVVIAPLPYPRVLVNTPQALNVNKTLHNNGPYGPVNVSVAGGGAFVPNAQGTWGQLPGDCTIVPPGAGGVVALPVSVPTPFVENFTIQCNSMGMGQDTDGDTLIDEDSIDFVDNDLQGGTDEDSAYQVAVFCFTNSITLQGQHLQDPNPANNVITFPNPLACTTVNIVRPFAPTFSMTQSVSNGPGEPIILPVGDDCLVTLPCEQNFLYGFPAGQPTAGTIILVPQPAYAFTNGNVVPNGDLVGAGNFAVTLKIGAGAAPCNVPAGGAFNLQDGMLPVAFGGTSNTLLGGLALVSTADWPERLEASPLYRAFNEGGPTYGGGTAGGGAPFTYAGAPVWSRSTQFIAALGQAANVVIFNIGTHWASVLITSDPSLPPNPVAPQICTPVNVQADYLGESGGPGAPGLDLRVCTVINTIPGHIIIGQFQRTDTGQSLQIPEFETCSAENDVSISKTDAPNPDVPANIPTQLPINIAILNGAVPGNVNASVSLIGPAICSPVLIGTPAGPSGLGTKTIDILTGPITIGPLISSRLDWVEVAMQAFELRNVVRNYQVNCPLGGPYNMQIVVNASSGAGFPDPVISNNQDENHPAVVSTDNDLDNDTVPNAVDNCPANANANQANNDGDALGDVCDPDDDNDNNADVTDSCDFAAEDYDGIDDFDGCPDTDATIKYVIKNEPLTVDVSVSQNQLVRVGVQNTGNMVASIEATLLLRSTVGQCEARWQPQPGDGYIEDTVGTTLLSEIDRVLPNMLPGETREIARTYGVHCFQKSDHPAAIRFEAGVAPVFPVTEEDASDNVHKNDIDITAWSVADVKKLGIIALDPAMVVSQNQIVTVRSVFHNNGPYGYPNGNDELITVLDDITANAPADCTVNGQQSVSIPNTPVELPVSVDVVLDQDFTLHCTQPSNHTWTFNDCIDIANVHVRDPNPNNNCASLQLTNTVTAAADIKGAVVTIAAPATAPVNTNFNVTVTHALHNNGPYGPVNANVTSSLNVPADCTKTPNSTQSSNNVVLPVSVPVQVAKIWVVKCTTISTHNFTASSSATLVPTLHVADPNTQNNSGVAQQVSTGITTSTDVKVTSFTADDQMPTVGGNQILVTAGAPANPFGPAIPAASSNFQTHETIHNNGPYSPVDVSISKSVGDTPECNVTPNNQGGNANLAISTSVSDDEAWSVAWTNPQKPPYSCNVTFSKIIAITTNHVIDSNTQNNSASVGVTFVRDADGDTVPDNFGGFDDNCQDVPNPGQQDSDQDGTGDACDDQPDHDDLVKYCQKFGPAPINLSDNVGAYMWVLCEIGNDSGHDDLVVITSAANLITSSLPNGCTKNTSLLIPGATTFILLDGEQKFVLYRTKFECHAPATVSVIPLTVSVNINHQDTGGGDDTHTANDTFTVSQNINIGPQFP